MSLFKDKEKKQEKNINNLNKEDLEKELGVVKDLESFEEEELEIDLIDYEQDFRLDLINEIEKKEPV